MRKVTYGAACSLDGFIATPDHGVEWLRWSDDVRRLTATYWSRVDTVLMGRKTYEIARAHGGGRYPGVANYVFSRSLIEDPEPGVHLIREGGQTFVRKLKATPGGEICVMGGSELARGLFEAGLIDEVGVNVQPILLGDGVPLFRRVNMRTELDLVECAKIAHGCVYMLYRIVREA